MGTEGDLKAYWFFNSDNDGGFFIDTDGNAGWWDYDEGTTDSGNWRFNDESGDHRWSQDEFDSTVKIDNGYTPPE